MVGNPDFLMGQSQEDLASEFQELETPEGELHLRFQVPSGRELALPATGIREVLDPPPDRITPHAQCLPPCCWGRSMCGGA